MQSNALQSSALHRGLRGYRRGKARSLRSRAFGLGNIWSRLRGSGRDRCKMRRKRGPLPLRLENFPMKFFPLNFFPLKFFPLKFFPLKFLPMNFYR
jgi:hypothetical protein